MRPIGSHNENANAAKMEKLLEDGINAIGLGSQGRNLFEENKVIFNERKEAAKQAIYPEVKFIR